MTAHIVISGRYAVAGALLAMFAPLPQAIAVARTPNVVSTTPNWWPGSADRLAAREQIEALSTEYYYRIDHGEAESVAELFVPDGVFHPGGSPVLTGREAIRAYYAARSKTRITRHVSTNLRLTYVDADHVEAVRTITHFGGTPAAPAGTEPADPSVMEYRENLVRGRDGQWRYVSRKVTGLFTKHGAPRP